MTDLTTYNHESIKTIQLLTELMPDSEKAKITHYLNQGFRLKLSTIIGNQPDVQLTLVNDSDHEILLYSLLDYTGGQLQ